MNGTSEHRSLSDRPETPVPALAGDPNQAYRHPLTVLAVLTPPALAAECYRWWSGLQERLLADTLFTGLGHWLGLPLLPVLILVLGCGLALLIHRAAWQWPRSGLVLQILGWSLCWGLVRLVIGVTCHQLLGDQISGDQISSPGGDPSDQLALAMAGALQEELLFRALGIGGLALVLRGLGTSAGWAAWLALLPSSLLFAGAHTSLLNHGSATPLDAAVLVQHGFAGLLYGLIFIRQGLAVCCLAHATYNALLIAGTEML